MKSPPRGSLLRSVSVQWVCVVVVECGRLQLGEWEAGVWWRGRALLLGRRALLPENERGGRLPDGPCAVAAVLAHAVLAFFFLLPPVLKPPSAVQMLGSGEVLVQGKEEAGRGSLPCCNTSTAEVGDKVLAASYAALAC